MIVPCRARTTIRETTINRKMWGACIADDTVTLIYFPWAAYDDIAEEFLIESLPKGEVSTHAYTLGLCLMLIM
jgi:hypothetical protein